METFLDTRRLLNGPWQAFERDVARLLVANGFDDVRVVGGSGDKGADVLGVKAGELWVVQCKFVSNQYPTPDAVDEVVQAARFYEADRLVVAASRAFGPATFAAVKKWAALGIRVELLPAATLIEMARRSPEYPRGRRQLRPYQADAAEQFIGALRETGKGQVVLATGLGKTVVMAEVVSQLYREEAIPEGKVLVMAGTRELVDQLQRSFWDQLPKSISTHRLMGGEEPSYWDGITFATVQSVMSRLDDLPRFGLDLVDEAHHVGSESFRTVVKTLNAPMLGGVTATPWRGDGYDIDQILGQPVVRVGIAEGLRNGFLCDADYRLLADNVDWEFVRDRSVHNYSLQQLNRKLLIPTRDEEAAKIIRESFTAERRRAGVVFCSTVVHARAFAAMLRLFGFRAEAITGDMDPRARDKTMAAFRRGNLDIVTTRDLFNEGVDVPDVDMIAFMRVTHSRRIFVQQLGRGLRLSPGKEKVVVLDFVSDLRRIAEVIELERAAKGDVETLRLGGRLVQFRDVGASSFMLDWMKDQADLFNREGDPTLELPEFDFPPTGSARERPMKLPDEVRDRIRDLLWERATELGWSGLSDTERSRYYEQWTRETAIGGTLGHYMDPRKVRVYIKDSLLKPFERARMSGTEQDILAVLDVDPTVEIAHRYIKPHGLRFVDGQIIAWGKSRDWKLILMAMFERTALNPGASSFGTALLECGNTADERTRTLVREAAMRLGIARVEWID